MFGFLSADADALTVVTRWTALGVIVVLAGIIAALSFTNKKLSTRTIAMAGVTLALSYVLSLIRFAPVPNGGEITLASLVPIMLFAYFYGFFPGLLTGVIFGLVQFVVMPYILTPLTFFLDYVFPYSCIAIVPLFKFIKNKTAAISAGVSAAYAVNFIFHFVSGIIYWKMGMVIDSIPSDSAIIFSLLYNLSYLAPDFIIALAAAIALSITGVIGKIEKIALK